MPACLTLRLKLQGNKCAKDKLHYEDKHSLHLWHVQSRHQHPGGWQGKGNHTEKKIAGIHIGAAPLLVAVDSGQLAIVIITVLLAASVAADLHDADGRTSLHAAVSREDSDGELSLLSLSAMAGPQRAAEYTMHKAPFATFTEVSSETHYGTPAASAP